MYKVNVTGLSQSTTRERLSEFFSFCGKIANIEYADKTATIYFEKPNAAHTALMLNGGTLDDATLTVSSDETAAAHADDDHSAPLDQADKPRAGIAAEYLAKGYKLSDAILHRAIEIDNQQGISQRFLSFFRGIDSTVGARALGPEQTVSGKLQSAVGAATEQARTVDTEQGLSRRVGDYYHKALASPLGQKVYAFYTSTSKQVMDIHEEALRIAGLDKEKNKSASSTASASQETPKTV